MRKFLVYLTTLMMVLVLAACSSGNDNTQETDNDKEDEVIETSADTNTDSLEKEAEVLAYVEEVRLAYQELAELGAHWDELRQSSANGEISDYDLAVVIWEDILPVNNDLVTNVESILPPTDETVEVNEILIDAVSKQHLAFSEIVAAIDTGDTSKITSANEILNEVRKLDREFARKMESLITKYGIN
ncbi:hypothetical protein [Solibacillus sp. FSL W8-0372]|uniref:hypothetical protein n=1 Tax=Solibacillus sp. FSL W8-0372 TaxID=2921713 RepID=UPI0030CAEF22